MPQQSATNSISFEQWQTDLAHQQIQLAYAIKQDTHLSRELLVTAALWPLHPQHNYDPQSVQALLQQLAPRHSGQFHALINTWPNDLLEAASASRQAVQQNTQLALAFQQLALPLASQFREALQSRFTNTSPQLIKQIEAALVNVGGTQTIGQLNLQLEDNPEARAQQRLRQAQQLYQTLPTDVVPAVNSFEIAPQSRLSRLANPYFLGRDPDLLKVATGIKQSGTTVISTGIGGIGKTSLATEFAYRYGKYFLGGVFWISLADPQNIESEIAACGERMGLFGLDEKLTLQERCERVYRAWAQPIPRLLIFDNCDHLSEQDCRSFFERYLPKGGGSRVLITSRNSQWPANLPLQQVPLGLLERADSIALLQKYRENLSDEQANAIAQELGDLPLALTLAGRFLAKYASASYGDPALYLQQIQAHKFNNRFLDTIDEGERNVYVTFDLSFQRLLPQEHVDEIAIALLSRAMYFAPSQAIPSQLLTQSLDPSQESPDEDQLIIQSDGLIRLLELGLLEESNEDNVQIHRLISEFCHTQQNLQSEQAQEQVEQVVIAKTHNLVNDKIPSRLQAMLPHLYHRYWATEQQNNLRNANLALALGRVEQEQYNYQQALVLYEHSARLNEVILGTKHPTTASSLNNLAGVYYAQGRYDEAEPLYLHVLHIRQQVLGPEHFDTARIVNNLATLYKAQGRYQEAELAFIQALQISEQILGKKHPDTAIAFNNLASLYEAQGLYAKAEQLYQNALLIREQVLGPKHLDTAATLNNLAGIYEAQGYYNKAETLYIEAFNIHEQTLGAEHPETVSLLSNLAGIYELQGKHHKIEQIYLRSLQIHKQVLGDEHPNTIIALNNLASFYNSQQRYDEAETLYLRALQLREQLLGKDHTSIARILSNLAFSYQEQQRYDEAEPLYLRALQIYETTLGAEHPDTATLCNNLASLYSEQTLYHKAEPLYQRSLAIHKHIFGKQHPDTALAINNLAFLYEKQGKLKEAEELYLSALEIYEQTLGSTHPDTITSLDNLAFVHETQGQYRKAEPFYLRSLEIREQLFGKEHPDTKSVQKNLEIIQFLAEQLDQAQLLINQALADITIDRLALYHQLEEAAQYYANGEEEGSPYYVLAEQLRTLAARLRNE
jgi:tetratricopeptide (TPR) repeat protein